MLAIILVLGSRAFRSAGLRDNCPSAAHRRNLFQPPPSKRARKVLSSAVENHPQRKSTVIGFSRLSSCPEFSKRGPHASKQTWFVQSNWDRCQPIGISGIGVSENREREFCALQNRDTRFPDEDEGGPQKSR
jgi:hypothetical protein